VEEGASQAQPIVRRGTAQPTFAVGHRAACTVTNGQIQCWQQGYNGNAPWTVTGLQQVTSIALAKWLDTFNPALNLAVLSNGSVWSFSTCPTCNIAPAQISGLANIVAVAVGTYHACALRADGVAWCWGSNASGQLGNGAIGGSSTPVQVTQTDLIAIAAGFDDTCAIDALGTAYCWGANTSGELGNSGGATGTPTAVSGISNAVQIDLGKYVTCVARADGSAWCWGNNGWAQLGNGTIGGSSSSPVQVALGSNVHSISIGNGFDCALVDGGAAYCWGANFNQDALGGQNQTSSYYSTPQPVYNVSGATAIGVWINGGCAQRSDGTVACWGDGNGPNLAYVYGTPPSNTLPNTVAGIGGSIAEKVAGGYAHTCGLRKDGTVKCWGLNNRGQLGVGNTNNSSLPELVPGLGSVIDLAAGNAHSCAVLGSGSVLCWGANSYGQLGVGDTSDRSAPTTVFGISDAIAVTAQAFTTCALHSNGTVSCWGYGSDGELGNGMNSSSAVTPVAVSNLTGITAISASAAGYHTCAISATFGSLSCWGWNYYGQLGNGNTMNSNLPVTVAGGWFGLGIARSVAAGAYHTCAAINNGGGVRCWGSGTDGELGNGAYNNSPTEVQVSFSASWTDVDLSAGYHFTCARFTDGSAKCWGWNYYGTIGDNGTGSTNLPISVAAPDGGPLLDIVAIGSGSDHSCLIQSSGGAMCWGGDFYGQLGNGSTNQQLIPGPVTSFP
jgi:alpha-tubulin suppressor-like RCC1 family protein